MDDFDGMSPREGDQAAAAAEADFERAADDEINERMHGFNTESLEGTHSTIDKKIIFNAREESANMRAAREMQHNVRFNTVVPN